MCLFAGQTFSQLQPVNPDPLLLNPTIQSGNLKSSENSQLVKSFYQSKADWQTIIDTTWGPGLPLNDKLAIFDTYTGALTTGFAGFNSLGIDPAEWDSIKDSYRSRINSSTSKGAFAALMSHLTYDLRDIHNHAWDTTVLLTALNPGIPILVIGAFEISHFGAILTVLHDSSLLVLRVIDDHPLGLRPGDIMLGYEGVPWKDLVDELLGSGIPILSIQRNSKSAIRHVELASAGINWHLFETIDIVKYANGDTVHLPVYPLQNLVVPAGHIWLGGQSLLWNNEQLPVPGVPFQDPIDTAWRFAPYGIVEGTNIGYIYLYGEAGETDDQFYEAVKSLSGTEGLIIDLRLNFGGSPIPFRGLNLLFNTRQYTMADVTRCNQSISDFSLCPTNDQNVYLINGKPMSWYDRPLAVLTGPNCVSSGDCLAYMFGYHPMVHFFGKSTCAALSGLIIDNFPGWSFWYSYCDAFLINDAKIFLNHREFPVDDSIWFDKESVAAGKDAVVEKAMDWIRNLSYAHNVKVNPGYVIQGTGTATFTAEVENPNDHNLSVYTHITSADSAITDSVYLYDDGNHNDGDPGDGTWGALWPVPAKSTIFSADVTTEDITAGTSRSITAVAKFTTIGPVMADEINYTGSDKIPNPGDLLPFKVTLHNYDPTESAVKIRAKLASLDTSLADMPDTYIEFATIAPGGIITRPAPYKITISEDCPVDTVIPVKVEISSDYYTLWIDTFTITVLTSIPEINDHRISIYPNPAENLVNIEISKTGGQETEIELLTVTGQVIYRKDYHNSRDHFTEQINFSGYASGLYFVRVRQSGTVYYGKIIVQ